MPRWTNVFDNIQKNDTSIRLVGYTNNVYFFDLLQFTSYKI